MSHSFHTVTLTLLLKQPRFSVERPVASLRPAHLDLVSEVYEGPLNSTTRATDIEDEPLTHHVSVYHSGRSDEPASKPEKPEEEQFDIPGAAKALGGKSGLSKKGTAHLDYPVSEVYEGPLGSINRATDIEGEPLTLYVTVYHSGRSDEPASKPEKPEEEQFDIPGAAKALGGKSGLSKKGTAHLDYPVSEVYEGPLGSINRATDIEGEPLTLYVTVYHSGRSDEPASKPEKPEEEQFDIPGAAKALGGKSGLSKKGTAHLDYPVSEVYEGPLGSINRVTDIDCEPLTLYVTVYHSGRSDEQVPKPEEEGALLCSSSCKPNVQ
ncbi:unnamed protein product [Cylicocyclus nassatus]|uniref:Uncharacterized protein n=1 Tax=Cylicocyclus nassatus TaxID=53992 RepID=A0AA36DUG2_CYLNA|nr:unnamed protein product [Cylicocyclus nassatus]